MRPKFLGSQSVLARFYHDPKKLQPDKIHWSIFKPQKKYPKELSLYSISGLHLSQQQRIAERYVDFYSGKKSVGYAHGTREIYENSLRKFGLVPANEKFCFESFPFPHFRHVNLRCVDEAFDQAKAQIIAKASKSQLFE